MVDDSGAAGGRRVVRKVLLAVRAGHADPRLLAAARSLCERMQAGLDILVRAPDEGLPAELAEFVASLRVAGIVFGVTCKPALRRRDIVNHANAHECIATVVIDSLAGWEGVAEDRDSDPWAKLACPLVTAARPGE